MTEAPLDKIRIASPCSANWDEMYGNERKRFCKDCKLNVYDLSGLRQRAAEDLLLNSEGRVCLRVFRRRDGTVITEDCRVGRKRITKRRSKILAIAAAAAIGILGGLLSQRTVDLINSLVDTDQTREVPVSSSDEPSFGIYGMIENLPELKSAILANRPR
jgi:hypothetical protein